MSKQAFLTDVQTLRKRARQHIDEGAVTAGYNADRATVLKLLNDSLATEIVCVLRYRRHHFMAKGIHSKSIADEFLVHSNEEQVMPTRLPSASSSWAASPTFRRTGWRAAATRNTWRAPRSWT